jgi:hypothetical protein
MNKHAYQSESVLFDMEGLKIKQPTPISCICKTSQHEENTVIVIGVDETISATVIDGLAKIGECRVLYSSPQSSWVRVAYSRAEHALQAERCSGKMLFGKRRIYIKRENAAEPIRCDNAVWHYSRRKHGVFRTLLSYLCANWC